MLWHSFQHEVGCRSPSLQIGLALSALTNRQLWKWLWAGFQSQTCRDELCPFPSHWVRSLDSLMKSPWKRSQEYIDRETGVWGLQPSLPRCQTWEWSLFGPAWCHQAPAEKTSDSSQCHVEHKNYQAFSALICDPEITNIIITIDLSHWIWDGLLASCR